jgi:hypothetical protein
MGIGAIVFAHVRAMSSQRLPILAVTVSALVLAGYAAYMLAQYGRIGHASDKHYLTSLYPPALRVDKGTSVDRFIDQAALLKAQLDKEAGDPVEEDREYPE